MRESSWDSREDVKTYEKSSLLWKCLWVSDLSNEGEASWLHRNTKMNLQKLFFYNRNALSPDKPLAHPTLLSLSTANYTPMKKVHDFFHFGKFSVIRSEDTFIGWKFFCNLP